MPDDAPADAGKRRIPYREGFLALPASPGERGQRQVEDAKVGLTHTQGNGGVCVINILKR